ncbi:MAG: hypothetical protein VXY33_08550 [Verrucomicrobiota bacterium]|nr:hypothetical protein [Verrucomicrobiota bacterium]MEC8659235.1 hypothetical protein [Verrucomicrobiota bacterium]
MSGSIRPVDQSSTKTSLEPGGMVILGVGSATALVALARTMQIVATVFFIFTILISLLVFLAQHLRSPIRPP